MAKQRSSSTRKKRSSKKSNPGPITQLVNWVSGFRYDEEQRARGRKTLGWSLIFLGVISLVACISYFVTGNADQSLTELGADNPEEINNWLGFIGAKLAEYIIRRGFGIFGFIPILFGLLTGLVLLEDEFYHLIRRLLKYVLFITLFGSVFLAYIEILTNASSYDLGGGFGYATNMWLFRYVGKVGVAFLLLFSVVIFLVVYFNAELRASELLSRMQGIQLSIPTPPEKPKNKPAKNKARAQTGLSQKAAEHKTVDADGRVSLDKPEENKPLEKGASVSFDLKQGDSQSRGLPPSESPQVARQIAPAADKKSPPAEKSTTGGGLELDIVQTPVDEPIVALPEAKTLMPVGEDNIGKIKGEEVFEKIVPVADQEIENIDDVFEPEDFDPTLELSDYQTPPWELLEDHGGSQGREVNREELENNKNKIVKTLEDYGIKINHIKATIGPTVTLYEIVPAPGVRISKIKNLEDDIALSLAALGIRIIAPIPGKGTIGIEVPNSQPEVVSLRGVMTTQKFINFKGELPIAFGRTISNEVFVADLNKMPHLLIAGATGQGKSVGLNTILASLLYKKHPAEIKFVLIDPKKVEMSLYQMLRQHFLAQLPGQEDESIVTDVRDAVNVLKSLCIEMDNRYDLLKKARVRNLKEYNTKFKSRKLNPRKGHRFLPYIILVIDELADMMMVAGKEVEMPIARLAQLARAVGIHLVVATQRPSVNVITGIIKANFPARMSYRVISKVDSRTILDANGADQLIGRGDMLLSTGSELIRIQNAFIDTPEVERIVEFIGRQRGFPEPYFLPELPSEDGDEPDGDEPFEKDSRFEEAARLLVRYQIGSASLIQRKLKLGYNRAGRIIDQLERAKIVGPHSGSKARDVLISDEAELERYLENI